MAQIKMSKDEWDKLTKLQQNYIVNWAAKMGVSGCKAVISAAKRQSLEVIAYMGSWVVAKDGNYQYSGDQKKMIKKPREATPDSILNVPR